MKLYWEPLQCFKLCTVLQKTKNIQNGRPFLLCVPTTVRHEKRKQSRSAGLCLRYPRNNSPQQSLQMIEGPCTGPSVRAGFSVWFLSPAADKRGAESESRPPWIIETRRFFYRVLTITGWVHQHDKISACWLIGKAVICHPIKPCGFVKILQCFSQTSSCYLW